MIVHDYALGMLALAALVAPGWMIARASRVPQPLLAGFIGGTVAMVAMLLALDALGVRLTVLSVGTVWLGGTAAAAWLSRKKISQPAPGDLAPIDWRGNLPLFLVLVPAFAVVVYRAGTQPLFGIDTIFRWNFLAEQMLAHESLGFYPPASPADYETYSWPDGIAPAVSGLYFWTYALARAARPALTTPLVVFQFCLLVIAAHGLARQLFSARAAAFACALLACSPVVLWATAMGQETGLIAIAVLALLLYLPRDRASETTGAVIAAGLAAGLGALAREYGLVLPVLGLAIAGARRLSGRTVLIFVATTVLVAAPWYARNWIRTGNPLFDLDVLGWFPINQTHAWLNQSYQAEFGWAALPPRALRFAAINCAAALLGGAIGGAIFFRSTRALLAAAAVVIALWVSSVNYTAAGFTTAIRVLSPALVLGAVLGGAACARWIPREKNLAAASLALGLFAVDAALRALTLPGTVYRIPPSDWLTAGGAVHEYHQRPHYRELARAAGAQRMLVLGPNALLTRAGARTLPLWSPEVSFLFDDALAPAEIARKLRALGIGFVLLNKGPANERFLAHSAFFRDPKGTLRPAWADADMILLVVAPPPSPP
jgi:hypothetical protein